MLQVEPSRVAKVRDDEWHSTVERLGLLPGTPWPRYIRVGEILFEDFFHDKGKRERLYRAGRDRLLVIPAVNEDYV